MNSKRLRELRKEKGLTMKELGEMFGVSEATISLYENGKRTPNDALKKKLADFFKVSVDYLLGLSNYKNIFDKFDAIYDIEKLAAEVKELEKNSDPNYINVSALTYEEKETIGLLIENIDKLSMKKLKILLDGGLINK